MRDAVIIDAIRSPMAKGKVAKGGRPGGAFSEMHPTELLSQVFQQLIERTGVDAGEVEDVITGCVGQVGEQAGLAGRWAWLAAGLPEHVSSTSVNRACGSGQQAADYAAQGVLAGAYDIVVAAGVELMSRVPMFTAVMGKDNFGPLVTERYAPGLVPQGVSAELIAARWNLTRRDLDEYAARSHELASMADLSGEIVPITVNTPDGRRVVDADETIRPGTTVDGLSELSPVFTSDEYTDRFPEINWSLTAGNSSQVTDGASAMLIMSAERAASLNLTPRARFHSFAVAAGDPIEMLTGPIPATEKILKRSGLTLDQIDHFEVNEAFASVPLAWLRQFDVDPARLNPRGGAIALGHPLGASGGRLMSTMLNGLEQGSGRYGLQTMCEAGGNANATIIERLG